MLFHLGMYANNSFTLIYYTDFCFMIISDTKAKVDFSIN